MSRHPAPSRTAPIGPGRPARRLLASCLVLLGLGLGLAPAARGQQPQGDPAAVPDDDPLAKILNEEKRAGLKKEPTRPPFEFTRSQVLPNDILPFIKANHWTMMGLEIRANHDDYDGLLRSRPVRLLDQPNEVVYRRDARLLKGQQARLTLPIFLPAIPKELGFQLVRPEALRQDEDTTPTLKVLEPHQHLVVVLAKEANDAYARWTGLRATIPAEINRDDSALIDQYRYYRMVLPLDPEKPLLSPHPLTWGPISHVIWDALPPERLGIAQQQALLDWLHWGGQLVIAGGAGGSFAPLRESFLAPYLPAEPSGDDVTRTGEQLAALADAYRPPVAAVDSDGDPIVHTPGAAWGELWNRLGRRYKPPTPIRTAPGKPIFVAGLRPRAGATAIPLGGPDDPPLAVECRVGRGRITMLAVGLTDPDLTRWEGYDTLLRRVVLRRPEEPLISAIHRKDNGEIDPTHYALLNGPDLTGVRYLARNLGAPDRKPAEPDGSLGYTVNGFAPSGRVQVPINEWLDSSTLPRDARAMLEGASGIEIPNPGFVLKVILGYLLALVPVNWLVCRYLFGRRELAWVIVPVLALGFAYGVERAAAYDVGFDSSCDEVDLIETHGDYPRGHLSRFASIYSTGRVRFTIGYPQDPSAVALPLATERSLRGEDVVQSTLRTQPFPALTDFLVQPRSLSLFRAEQMPTLPGTVALAGERTGAGAEGKDGPRTITNTLGFDLADAWVVAVGRDADELQGRHVGALANGASAPLGEFDEVNLGRGTGKPNSIDPGPFEKLLVRASVADATEELGEIRLIGRVDKLMPGQAIDPPVDRHRGFTLVVAHLRPPVLPDPASRRYNTAPAGGDEPVPPDPRAVLQPPDAAPAPAMMGGGPGRPAPRTAITPPTPGTTSP